MKHNRKKLLRLLVSAILGLCLITIGIFGIYVSDYYSADTQSISEFSDSINITKTALTDNCTAYIPEQTQYGMIFYPGGKVEHTAYEPLMMACAEKGILCLLFEMPFNLAVFDIKAASGTTEHFPDISHWYMAGHSLGGSMAASYLLENMSDFDGLILLGSYSIADLSDTGLKVLSIYGSEDTVLNKEKYEQYNGNLPKDFSEYIIEGGCHAYFGMYGPQEGDGNPSISNEEQLLQTAEKIIEFIED